MWICFVDSSSTERPSLKEFFWLNYLHRTHDTHTHKHTNIFELNSVNMQHKHTFSRCLYKISHSYLVPPVAFRNRNNTIDDDKYSKTSGISVWMCYALFFMLCILCAAVQMPATWIYTFVSVYTTRTAIFICLMREWFVLFSSFRLKFVPNGRLWMDFNVNCILSLHEYELERIVRESKLSTQHSQTFFYQRIIYNLRNCCCTHSILSNKRQWEIEINVFGIQKTSRSHWFLYVITAHYVGNHCMNCQ